MSVLLEKQNETDILTLLNELRLRPGIELSKVDSVVTQGEKAKAEDINYVISKIMELKSNTFYAYNWPTNDNGMSSVTEASAIKEDLLRAITEATQNTGTLQKLYPTCVNYAKTSTTQNSTTSNSQRWSGNGQGYSGFGTGNGNAVYSGNGQGYSYTAGNGVGYSSGNGVSTGNGVSSGNGRSYYVSGRGNGTTWFSRTSAMYFSESYLGLGTKRFEQTAIYYYSQTSGNYNCSNYYANSTTSNSTTSNSTRTYGNSTYYIAYGNSTSRLSYFSTNGTYYSGNSTRGTCTNTLVGNGKTYHDVSYEYVVKGNGSQTSFAHTVQED